MAGWAPAFAGGAAVTTVGRRYEVAVELPTLAVVGPVHEVLLPGTVQQHLPLCKLDLGGVELAERRPQAPSGQLGNGDHGKNRHGQQQVHSDVLPRRGMATSARVLCDSAVSVCAGCPLDEWRHCTSPSVSCHIEAHPWLAARSRIPHATWRLIALKRGCFTTTSLHITGEPPSRRS